MSTDLLNNLEKSLVMQVSHKIWSSKKNTQGKTSLIRGFVVYRHNSNSPNDSLTLFSKFLKFSTNILWVNRWWIGGWFFVFLSQPIVKDFLFFLSLSLSLFFLSLKALFLFVSAAVVMLLIQIFVKFWSTFC